VLLTLNYCGRTLGKLTECCDYGNDNAVDILLNLLVDDGIPGVGHRLICLSNSYTKIGISIQPHKVYEVNTVMDFKWR
jgi:uncharacterized protein YkwD